MSKESKLIETISEWKNKHSAEVKDTKALDVAIKSVLENSQRIVELKAQLESALGTRKILEKDLADNFAKVKAARKEASKEVSKETKKTPSKGSTKVPLTEEQTKAPVATKAKAGKKPVLSWIPLAILIPARLELNGASS